MQFTLTKFVLLSLLFPSSSYNEAEDVKTFLENFDEKGQNKIKQHLTDVQALFQRFVKSTKEAVINSPLQGWMAQKVNESLKYGKPADENDAKAIRNIRSKAMLLQEKDWKELKNVSLEMLEIYMGKICAERNATGHCLDQWELYPTLRHNFSNARDEAELLRYWGEWYHVKTNDTVILNNFERMVKLYHNGSVSMNCTDIVDCWEDQYRSDALKFSLEEWTNESFFKLLPLYEELHAYAKYQVDKTSDKLTIAAHLVGDLFAESWQCIYLTHGSNLKLNYTAKLKEKFENQYDMLDRCVKYFGEIGFKSDSVCKTDSNCEVSKEREKICRPTTLSYPFGQGPDWMSMCAEVAMDDLNDMFVLVGRLVYSNYYKNKDNPVYFQDAANPGMFDSLGKAVALAFNSPSNLNKSGLINIRVVDDELRFEHLYKQALITIPSMMHAFAVDRWLRSFLRGVSPMKKFNWTILNDNWWQTLENYTGISRPSFENDYRSVDFLQVPRIAILEPIGREFFSTAVSYQLFEVFCNSTEPKERTNFDQCYIKDIGESIEEVEDFLSSGSSLDSAEKWLRKNAPSVEPLLRYFRPLYDMLVKKNSDNHLCRGWGVDDLWTEEIKSHLLRHRCQVSTSEPTPTPFTPTSTPSEPTSTPSTPKSTPSDPTSTPSTPTPAPSTSTPATSTSTPAPSDPTSATSTPTSTPSEPTSTPSTPKSTPSDPTSTPSEPTSTPSTPKPTPSDPTSTPCMSTPAPSTSTPATSTSTPTPSDPTSATSTPTSTPSEPTSTPSTPKPTPSDPTSTPSMSTPMPSTPRPVPSTPAPTENPKDNSTTTTTETPTARTTPSKGASALQAPRCILCSLFGMAFFLWFASLS